MTEPPLNFQQLFGHPPVEPAASQHHPELDQIPPLVDDRGKLRSAITGAYRVSVQQALDLFTSRYQHCRTPEFLDEEEREYKVHAHRLLIKIVGPPGGSRLGELSDHKLSAGLRAVYHATNIPSVHELTAINDALKDAVGTRAFARAVLACLNSPSATTFGALTEALDDLPVIGSRVLTCNSFARRCRERRRRAISSAIAIPRSTRGPRRRRRWTSTKSSRLHAHRGRTRMPNG